MIQRAGNGHFNVSFTIIFYRSFTHSRDDVTNLEGHPMQATLRAAFAIAILAAAVSTVVDRAQARSVCGVGGCTQIMTKRVQHQPVGFARRAAPLVIAKPSALQPVNASK